MTGSLSSLPTKFALASALSLTLFASLSSGQAVDRIRVKGGSQAGEITKMTPVSVTIERNGDATEVPVVDIRSIIFKDEPSELTQARLNANNGGYESALTTLESTNMSEVRNEFIRQEIEYYKAFCKAKLALVGSQDIKEAGTELNRFVTSNSQSYHFLDATQLLGDLLVATKRYSAAQNQYEKLAKAPWTSYRIRSGVLVGQTLIAQEKFDEALAQFDAVLGLEDDSADGKAQRLAAQLGRGVATAGLGKVSDGAAIVEQVIRDADPEDANLLAHAYNALGDCYRRAGEPKNALYAYLHTDLLYGRIADAHAEALYHLAPLWDSIGQAGEARKARQTLEAQYPASRWAKQSQ